MTAVDTIWIFSKENKQFTTPFCGLDSTLMEREYESLCSIKELNRKIEETREKMYKTYYHDPNDPQVLVISQCLDVLLNEYNQALKKAKKPK
ncbi:aspartyl-phosphate phosphatase Spo0E family protein [Virgibacillus siamensis]|uniref:aspartyl-phosphate phosphatase Spo0E family protein n=1 Tax=Virgibacillus siamensis TaxID=480071 RepID=UPI0031DB3216